MPPAMKRPCTYPGCATLTTTGRCDAHRAAGKWGDPRRGSRAERGYGPAWDRLRLVILARDNYLCQGPDCKGGALRLTVASEVDHVIPKAQWLKCHGTLAGVDDPCNLQAIGRECHKRKTAAENGRTVRPRIGADGYAVE